MDKPRKIVLAGGSGFLGNCLVKHYSYTETKVVVLTRRTKPAHKNISYVQWDGKTIGDWAEEIDGSDVVINLTGRSVNCRYNEKNRNEIINSRVDSTRVIGEAINSSVYPAKLWINSSSAAIYGDSGDEIMDESSPVADGFSPEVCKIWEKTFNEIGTPQTRKVYLRIGLVFGKGGGVLEPFVNVTKLGMGGTFGSGKQYISWIHELDFCRCIDWIIENDNAEGMIICTGPEPVTNKELMKTLREVLHVPFGLPNPAFMLKIGTKIIGTEAELILMGRRVVPKYLIDNGFHFLYPNLSDALTEILAKPHK